MIKLSIPEVGCEELEEIKSVLDSKYLVHGDKVEEFERIIADYLGVRYALAVSSGTAALHLALLALGIKRGDEVIVPDFTFPATSNVVELCGAVTRFVDIELDSLCMDTDKIEESIGPNTRFIMPVHEFGQAANMNRIMDLAVKYGLKVVEDAACALGTEFKGKKVGTIGNIGCFSFHPRKAITTGEGGLVVTDDDDVAQKLRELRNHGIRIVDGKVKFISAGFNYRLTNIQGAIGVAQLKKLDSIIKRRLELANIYNGLLVNVKGVKIPVRKDYGFHVYQTYHIILEDGIDRDKVIKELKDRGIETNYGAYAVHEQPYYREKYNYPDIHYPNSIKAYRQGLALPMHSQLDKEEIEYIVGKIKEIIGE